jgi:hypothetical protein
MKQHPSFVDHLNFFNKNMITKLELLTSKHSLPILVHRKVAVNVLAEFSYNTTNCKELDKTFSHRSQLTQLINTFFTKLMASPEQKSATALHCNSSYSSSQLILQHGSKIYKSSLWFKMITSSSVANYIKLKSSLNLSETFSISITTK